MAGLVFLLVFWALAGACQRHGVGVFLSCNSPSSLLLLAKPNFLGVLPPKRDSRPHVKFGASAGVLATPGDH